MSESKPANSKYWEMMLPGLAVASLVISCIIVSNKKNFWFDELFSYYFLSDPSFLKMLAAFHDKINNTPILYFALGWCWDKLFGSSELSYRLFSCLGFCSALCILWVILRRTFGLIPTALATLAVFCTSPVIFMQNAEARMYGLYLAISSIAVLIYEQLYRKSEYTNRLLIGNFFVHAALIHTHLFGPFYSAAILLALLLNDRLLHLSRPKLYFSIVFSWLTFLLYLPSFLIQADAGNPRTWMPFPTVKDLFDYYSLSSFLDVRIIYAALFLSALHFLFQSTLKTADAKEQVVCNNTRSKMPLVSLACILALVPAFVWVFSRTIKPIFWDRYMLPTSIGIIILLSFVVAQLTADHSSQSNQKANRTGMLRHIASLVVPFCWLLLIGYILLQPLWGAKHFQRQSRPQSSRLTYGHPDLPIVFLESNAYLVLQHYLPEKERYYYVLDWEAASSERSGVWSPQEYKHMAALKRQYPEKFGTTTLESNQFLSRYDRFLVMCYSTDTCSCPLVPIGLSPALTWTGMHCPQWIQLRFQNNPRFKVSKVENNDGALYLVEKQLK